MADIGQHRTQDAPEVEPAMVVEILVLGRDEGVNDILRDIVDRNEDAVFPGIFGNQQAVAGMHAAHDRRLILSQLLVIRQIIGDADDIDRHGNKADHGEHHCRYPAPQGCTHDITQCENLHDALWTLAPTVRTQNHDTAAALWPPGAEAQTDSADGQFP